MFRATTLVGSGVMAAAILGGSGDAQEPVGRPVEIASLSFYGKTLDEVVALVDAEGAKGADLICLPELWNGQGENWEALDGPIITAISALAKKHSTYIVCPLDQRNGKKRLNTAVLIERDGSIACTYDKVYPYWSEFDVDPPPATPGKDAPVYEADFGKIGMAICFDANFPEVWKRLADNGAELVVWPSAYSAGTTLQAHAQVNHFYIITSTWTRDCVVYDITGEEILYEKSDDVNVTRVTLDLDRGIYHQNFNIEGRDKLLAERADDVEQEQWLDREQWFVLRAKRPGVSARELAKQYGMEELRDYIDRSRRDIDNMRGFPFAKKAK